jgi:hypothetical protein
MRTIRGVWSVSLVAVALLASAVVPATASPSNKWRIEVNHDAGSAGEIVFKLSPVGGQPLEVRVSVAEGTKENHVAKAIRDAFVAQLPAEGFHVEVDDGEDVLVKKAHSAADFDMMVVSSTVGNVTLNLDKE